ncbi:MAG: bifunctional proline dehydrogenase/L-glutamate gamma-semialdehyde dehydrogenase [Tannerella sp.]|jgi:RHH-type proline utilization regulon transcriptional repressor/proline dehydrogenase/delta 1-pyrroline-5-carboxylate dehydrogenase|nr:bifunctional proline dehydrogenase/L-glutamate gamma-semialdehyde dehydrogenase [Tannerella sp.]
MENIIVTEVIEWAKQFLAKAEKELTPEEVKEQKKFASLIQTPKYKTFLTRMLDESSQIRDNNKLNKRVRELIKEYGVPDFFGRFDRFLLQLYRMGGFLFPSIAMPVFKKKLRSETRKIIIPEERPKLTKHLSERWKKNIGQNVNLLGEVVLGDGEANNRYKHYLEALEAPDINYISIKISGIYAQIHALSYEQNKKELCDMVAAVYQKSIDKSYIGHDGTKKAKFVNLDMEEYKDSRLTMDVFIEVLSRPQFKNYSAGIVIQAYLPDAESFQKQLLDFAKQRYAQGGAPLKMRLVKGANQQMESIISSLRGWENPVYRNKVDVDANYMHLLDIATQPENIKACHLGVASHNYFSIAYAHLLAEKNGVSEHLTFEMLEGMANNLPRVMRKLQKQIILYTPVVKESHFLNAISYLVRRLDENTGKDNFLSYSFNLQLDSKQWRFLAEQFRQAYHLKDSVRTMPFRTQDRTQPQKTDREDINVFYNEPDTDFDLPQNRKWALEVLEKWKTKINAANFKIPVQIGSREVETENRKTYYDRSRKMETAVCQASMSSFDQVRAIIEIAEKDASGWRQTSVDQRNEILHKAAGNLAVKRGDLAGCMAAITGKTFTEGDVEISEAIDFCRYYPISMKAFDNLPTVAHAPKGVVLVISPWNFPLAIPAGGVAASLSGGNTVILKPATAAMPVAWEFAKCFWEAGVPKDALQIVCPSTRESLNYMTAHPYIKHIILTGGTDTAFRLLKNSPRTPLSAETGGKNAIIVTGSADQDHAILNIVSSAFSNAGQKCSACSLLLLDRKIFEDETFKSKLKDAVTSLRAGSIWETMNYVGPMIDNDNDKLKHALETLEEGESWLVAPEYADEKKYILKPTVKWGVKPGSYTFKNELFAPFLSVVCIDNLAQGIAYVNASEYGLTAGLQSLNEEEHKMWKDTVEAGNLYINRGITGAIVRRQPFGGMKRSAFGGGIKAGGPNYVSCFVTLTEKELPEADNKYRYAELAGKKDRNRLNYAVESYRNARETIFSQETDVSHICGEENVFRYLPLKNVGFRIENNDDPVDIMLVILAADTVNTPLTVSFSEKNKYRKTIEKICRDSKIMKIVKQTTEAFIDEMDNYERVRICANHLSDTFYARAAELGKHIADNKPLAEGRLELLHYLKEQSIAYEYHRYGSIFGENK